MKRSALLVGKSHCIADKLVSSPNLSDLYVISDFENPGLAKVAKKVEVGNTSDPSVVAKFAASVKPDFAIIGSEEPLSKGVVDALNALGIPCVGPTQSGARLESSKSFTRKLIEDNKIPGNPEFRVFIDENGLSDFLREKKEFVVKPDGLTGGKGVKVFGEHLSSIEDAMKYCRELFELGPVVIEEKLDGEEFSFQSFFDGKNIAHTIPVQDHKRANNDDTGPNTGGMGSYTCADHLLPFLKKKHIEEASEINRRVGEALLAKTGVPYKGILYGGFMITKNGLRVIEYNARFGDPEVMNVLSLLETDFVDICMAIIHGNLNEVPVSFKRQASVCKYLVPEGYPENTSRSVGKQIDVQSVKEVSGNKKMLRVFYASVKDVGGRIELTNSRSLAVIGVADKLEDAEQLAETAAAAVAKGGSVHYRTDIGTARLIQKRVDHMDRILGSHVPKRPPGRTGLRFKEVASTSVGAVRRTC